MQNHLKNIIIEVAWLAITFCSAMFLCTYFFPWDMNWGAFDIQRHNRDYVIKDSHLISAVFVFLTFLIFFCRGMAKKFAGNLRNLITILSGSMLVYLVATINHAMMPLGNEWYAFKENTGGVDEADEIFPSASFVLQNTFILFELIIVCGMLYLCYQWGKARR